jgi:flagellar motility protein MotE (MotC chaperone)
MSTKAEASSGAAAEPAPSAGSISVKRDSKKKVNPAAESEAAAKEAEAAYKSLIAELTEQKQALDKKAAELAERERQVGVLREELKAQQAAAAANPAPAAQKPVPLQETESFKRMVKAYANMEGENAARALEQLYGKDDDVAVDLMLALPPRKAAAVLDALSSSGKQALAAEVSLEMSRRDPE